MGSSMFPNSGRPRYDASDLSRRAGVKGVAEYFRSTHGDGGKLADLLPILQSCYRPPSSSPLSTTDPDARQGAGFDSSLEEIERELNIQQLRFRAQITDRVENAIKCSRMVGNIFAGAVVILKVTHLVQIYQGW